MIWDADIRRMKSAGSYSDVEQSLNNWVCTEIFGEDKEWFGDRRLPLMEVRRKIRDL